MKRKLLLGLGLLLSIGAARAQFLPYKYTVNVDLDTTATFSHNGTGSSSVTRTSPSANQFFPHPGGAYNARALFTGTASSEVTLVPGKLTMKNPAVSLVKSSIYDIKNATGIAKIAFDLDLTNYTGLATFAITFGNDAGNAARLVSGSTTYANASNDIFGSFRVVKSGSFITQYRNSAGDASVSLTAVESLIKAGVSQKVEIFVNSTSNSTTYTHVSSPNPITLVANTYHVYVGDVKYAIDFPKNGTAYAQTALDGITFEFNNNATQETVGISNLSITYKTETNLPVSLTSFTGKLNNDFVDLKWATASEQNNSHFEVLRSSDSKSFSVLDRVAGNGTTSEPKEYNFTDRNPLAGTNYYLLKQYDLDGKENAIDKIVAIKTALGNSDFTVFVNKENQLTANVFSENQSAAKIGVYDISGKQVFQEDIRLEKGNNAFAKYLPFLQSGVYVLKLAANGNTQSIKFIK